MPLIQRNQDLREVYVWQVPVRFFHWVNAFVIVGLSITGFLIGDPPALMSSQPPSKLFTMGIIRFVHFAFGFVFIFNFLMRIYWFFAGNDFAKWYNYMPLRKKQWRGIKDTLKVDILLLTPRPIYDIGHNALAAAIYGGLFLVMILQSISGIMLISTQSSGFWAPIFESWMIGIGGVSVVRTFHHWMMWAFVLFSIVHIYLVFYHDYIEKNGIASSMIGGWKFIPKEVVEEYVQERRIKLRLKVLRKRVRQVKRQQEVHDENLNT